MNEMPDDWISHLSLFDSMIDKTWITFCIISWKPTSLAKMSPVSIAKASTNSAYNAPCTRLDIAASH